MLDFLMMTHSFDHFEARWRERHAFTILSAKLRKSLLGCNIRTLLHKGSPIMPHGIGQIQVILKLVRVVFARMRVQPLVWGNPGKVWTINFYREVSSYNFLFLSLINSFYTVIQQIGFAPLSLTKYYKTGWYKNEEQLCRDRSNDYGMISGKRL